MHNLEGVCFTNKVRAFPAQRGISVAAFGADYGFNLQLLGAVDDSLHELTRNSFIADL